MPVPALRAVARQTGASLRTVESKWKQAKGKVKPKAGLDRGKHSYRYLMGTVKHMAQNHMKHLRRAADNRRE